MNENSRLLRGIKLRKKRFFTILKIALVFYLMILSIKYVTSSTSAYFISSNVTTGKFTAGTWDYSKLKFSGNGHDFGNDNEKACPANIEVLIKNFSKNDMLSPSTYEIYFTNETGNPENHGKLIADGIIPKLKSNQEMPLNFETNIEGFYTFKAYQVNKSFDDVWSEKIKVKCKSKTGQTTNEQNEVPNEEQSKKSIENEKTETPETKTSEETGSENTANQTPENNEQSSTTESEEAPASTESNNGNQTPDEVNNSVTDETKNVQEKEEKDGQ
ncbi:amyloid fiber anchoring/assembly protein TapA [Bacillus timonensis]|uniref:amyloid fiber anchoring/assembly protein TapA n=1 Tax=Bacillus timonensis TaxID=1033734 RepID=UPI0013866D84|nr:amyloid fiber anchoring/assembly protein TapA [Bacillus timonensis]